jgi:hypothetical protein
MDTGRSLTGLTRRSITSLSATLSPALAKSIAVRVIASASPSIIVRTAMVVLLSAPLGRPGLPTVKRVSRFAVVLTGCAPSGCAGAARLVY